MSDNDKETAEKFSGIDEFLTGIKRMLDEISESEVRGEIEVGISGSGHPLRPTTVIINTGSPSSTLDFEGAEHTSRALMKAAYMGKALDAFKAFMVAYMGVDPEFLNRSVDIFGNLLIGTGDPTADIEKFSEFLEERVKRAETAFAAKAEKAK